MASVKGSLVCCRFIVRTETFSWSVLFSEGEILVLKEFCQDFWIGFATILYELYLFAHLFFSLCFITSHDTCLEYRSILLLLLLLLSLLLLLLFLCPCSCCFSFRKIFIISYRTHMLSSVTDKSCSCDFPCRSPPL